MFLSVTTIVALVSDGAGGFRFWAASARHLLERTTMVNYDLLRNHTRLEKYAKRGIRILNDNEVPAIVDGPFS